MELLCDRVSLSIIRSEDQKVRNGTIFTPAYSIFDALELRRRVREVLHDRGFSKIPLVNLHRKDGVRVDYHIKRLPKATVVKCPWLLNLTLRTEAPSEKTDTLFDTLLTTMEEKARRTKF